MAKNAIVILEQILNQSGEMLNLLEMGEQIDAEYIEKLSGISESMAEIHTEVFGDDSDDSEEDESEDEDSEDDDSESGSEDDSEDESSYKEAFEDKHKKEGLISFLEAVRGRPKGSTKSSKEEPKQAIQEPISVQLQNRTNNALVSVHFNDGSTHEIPREHANKALSMLNSLKPGPRGDAHAAMSKSKEHFYNTLKGHSFTPAAKPKVSLGSMKEETLDENIAGKFKNSFEWEKAAKARGLIVKSATHPSGEMTKYQVAKDKQGNNRGHFDHETKSGHLKEETLDEDVSKLSDARLKFHVLKGIPHGSFTSKELSAEHKRRKSTGGAEYTAVKPSMKEETLDEKRGLWDNIHAKRKRIKNGSGEKMRKPGSPGAPTEQDFAAAAESVEPVNELTKKTLASYLDKASKDKNKYRGAGTAMASAKHTPGLSQLILPKDKRLKVPASDAYKEEVELDETVNVHVSDGSKYGEKPHKDDIAHIKKGLDLYKGKHEVSTDKGDLFSFENSSSARNFKRHVDNCPKKTCHADLDESFKLGEGFSVSKHPVHGKILHKDGKPFLGSYDQADAHAAKHKGTLIKSLNPKKYMVKMPETKPTGDINESNLKESNLQIVNKAVEYIKTRKD